MPQSFPVSSMLFLTSPISYLLSPVIDVSLPPERAELYISTMGRGGAIYLSYTALVLLSAGVGNCVNPSVFDVNIDEGPAPSAADGPPFSAHAIRNKALLPYEIIAVVASYVGSVLILGTLLLTVGRTLRKRAQEMAARPQEMVKPMSKTFGMSPASPQSSRSWYKLRNKKSSASSIRSGGSNPVSPGMDSVVSFDQNVIEADRQRRQDEMERLYSAVMMQDAQKSKSSLVTAAEVPNSPPGYDRRTLPQLMIDDPRLRHFQADQNPTSPRSPVRAIYPPDADLQGMPQSPTSPIKAAYPNMPLTPMSPQYQASQCGEIRPSRVSRTPSFGSGKTAGSGKLRKSLRKLNISAPLQADDNSDGARTPLSPRFYTNPGVPPEPPTARTMDSENYPPTTPGTAGTGRSWRYPGENDEVEERMDEVRALPQPHPNRLSSYNYANEAQAVTDAVSKRRDPPRLPIGSTNNNTLPFRQMNEEQRKAAYAAAHPLSPGVWQQQLSAGPVKTTFLETRKPGMHSAMTPRTGMATPYSPYMPYTPLTPVTPHLTSRAERKQRRKEDHAIRGAITEEEQVADDKDMWSSGY